MENILKADIFFFISSIAIVVVGVALLVALIYIIKILRDIKHVSRVVREEGDKIIEDVEAVRKGVMSKLISLLNPFKRTNKKSKK